MATFECSGLMNPYYFKNKDYKKEDFIKSIKHNNFVLNGLSDHFQKNIKEELIIEKNNNNNINDKEKQLCKSVARNIKENTRWFDKKRFNEESLGTHCF
jgi:hypothetical protein